MPSRNINHTHSYRMEKIMIFITTSPPPFSIADVMKWKWKIRAAEKKKNKHISYRVNGMGEKCD